MGLHTLNNVSMIIFVHYVLNQGKKLEELILFKNIIEI